jgi:hypothetical protein
MGYGCVVIRAFENRVAAMALPIGGWTPKDVFDWAADLARSIDLEPGTEYVVGLTSTALPEQARNEARDDYARVYWFQQNRRVPRPRVVVEVKLPGVGVSDSTDGAVVAQAVEYTLAELHALPPKDADARMFVVRDHGGLRLRLALFVKTPPPALGVTPGVPLDAVLAMARSMPASPRVDVVADCVRIGR